MQILKKTKFSWVISQFIKENEKKEEEYLKTNESSNSNSIIKISNKEEGKKDHLEKKEKFDEHKENKKDDKKIDSKGEKNEKEKKKEETKKDGTSEASKSKK